MSLGIFRSRSPENWHERSSYCSIISLVPLIPKETVVTFHFHSRTLKSFIPMDVWIFPFLPNPCDNRALTPLSLQKIWPLIISGNCIKGRHLSNCHLLLSRNIGHTKVEYRRATSASHTQDIHKKWTTGWNHFVTVAALCHFKSFLTARFCIGSSQFQICQKSR